MKCPDCKGFGGFAPVPGDTIQKDCVFCNGTGKVNLWYIFIFNYIKFKNWFSSTMSKIINMDNKSFIVGLLIGIIFGLCCGLSWGLFWGLFWGMAFNIGVNFIIR